jgi:hypothetical protein
MSTKASETSMAAASVEGEAEEDIASLIYRESQLRKAEAAAAAAAKKNKQKSSSAI